MLARVLTRVLARVLARVLRVKPREYIDRNITLLEYRCRDSSRTVATRIQIQEYKSFDKRVVTTRR